jgi:hypothetical protein
MYEGESIWLQKGATLSDKSARQEFGLTQQEIVAAKPWGEHCTMYPSTGGTPVVTYIHSGGHLLPDDVPPVIVKFFKEHAKP